MREKPPVPERQLDRLSSAIEGYSEATKELVIELHGQFEKRINLLEHQEQIRRRILYICLALPMIVLVILGAMSFNLNQDNAEILDQIEEFGPEIRTIICDAVDDGQLNGSTTETECVLRTETEPA
jgi:hypothetical protein